jgi:hypothetical protein
MGEPIVIRVYNEELKCPTCGNGEMHPDGDKLLIRGFKVDNWSQCLVCAGYYDKDLNETPENFDKSKGWFPPPWEAKKDGK